jgi:uncharacterized protein VirK/YbjX
MIKRRPPGGTLEVPGGRTVVQAITFAALGLRHWRMMGKLWKAPEDTLLGTLLRARPEIWGMLQAPFISSEWGAETRFERIINHCETAMTIGAPFSLQPNEYVDLTSLSEINDGLLVKLDSPRWMLRDGLLVLSLWFNEDRIYSMAFTLATSGDRRIAYVGGIQGARSEAALEINRELTKTAHGVRPPDLLLEIFRMICVAIGVDAIFGVSNSNRHHLAPYFRQRADFVDPVTFDYDNFWNERGGTLSEGGFFALAAQSRPRPFEDIPERKRATYRRRREMILAIRDRIHRILDNPVTIPFQQHHPRWL